MDDLEDLELQGVLALSRREYNNGHARHGSTSKTNTMPYNSGNRDVLRRKLTETEAEINQCHTDIETFKSKIRQVESMVAQLERTRQDLLAQMDEASTSSRKGKGKASMESGVDYLTEKFDWSDSVLDTMDRVFHIKSFRLCQEGVVNAALDHRDIVCVMPTGGGKSLTYQLPAIIEAGVTLVISPLIALITDQILHLREANIEAVKLTGDTDKADTKNIMDCLNATAQGRAIPGREIKLIYVTPEKIAKSKTFMSVLSKLAQNSKLRRIVIDEAHCVSQLGHDFRPDYQKLRILRQLFPVVPITAVSATCPPRVLDDLIKTLGLKSAVDGTRAPRVGTVYFSAPLYRKNLHYQVLPKASTSTRVLDDMTKWILDNHPNDTGIVYCLSKKDTETVAAELMSRSDGKIKTGVYHASRGDGEKDKLHKQWRQGTIKVVCATIAFGLGIDKGDVRFVVHHCMSKTLDGFYQESGRAGRDGQDSDCVLFYRPQDASTLGAMTMSDKDGREKLHAMLQFAQNYTECRKLLFAQYFSHASQLSMTAWSTDDKSGLEPCGHCDNCTRPPEGFDRERDVTHQAWQVLKIAEELDRRQGRVTLAKLASIAKGNGGCSFDIVRGKNKSTDTLDLDEICQGKVVLGKDPNIEILILKLIMEDFLAENYIQTAYQTNVYVHTGPKAQRFTNRSPDKFDEYPSLTMKLSLPGIAPRKKKSAGNDAEKGKRKRSAESKSVTGPPGKRRRSQGMEGDDDVEDDESDPEDDVQDMDREEREDIMLRSEDIYLSVSDDDDTTPSYVWSHSLRDSPGSSSQPRRKPKRQPRVPVQLATLEEPIELSSD